MDSTSLKSMLLVLLCSADLCFGTGIIPNDNLQAPRGGSVTFTTSLKPTDGPFLALTWSFNGTTNVITSSTADVVGQGYKNRIELDKATGSLVLRNLTEEDSGTYEVIVIPFGAVQTHGSAKLEVSTQTFKPTIDCPTGNVIEGQTSLNLTCKSDSAVSTQWMKDGKPLVAGGKFNFYDGGRVLSIMPVDRTDTGVFACNVSNGVSFDSASCNIKVFYGPDRPIITQTPIGAELEESVTLFCSANSVPPAKFTWTFKNMQIFGAIHYIPEMGYRHLGRYTCKARNTVTGKEASVFHNLRDSSTSISRSLSVMVCTVLTSVGLMLL